MDIYGFNKVGGGFVDVHRGEGGDGYVVCVYSPAWHAEIIIGC